MATYINYCINSYVTYLASFMKYTIDIRSLIPRTLSPGWHLLEISEHYSGKGSGDETTIDIQSIKIHTIHAFYKERNRLPFCRSTPIAVMYCCNDSIIIASVRVPVTYSYVASACL